MYNGKLYLFWIKASMPKMLTSHPLLRKLQSESVVASWERAFAAVLTGCDDSEIPGD